MPDEGCTHKVAFHGLCALCGTDLGAESVLPQCRPGVITPSFDLTVTEAELRNIEGQRDIHEHFSLTK